MFGNPCIASSGLLGVCGDPLVSPFDGEADNPRIFARHDVDHQILTYSFLCTVQEQDLPAVVRFELDFETSYLDL